MVEKFVVDALVDIGRADVPRIPACLADKDTAWNWLMIGHAPWVATANSLDEEALGRLIRGLVLFSRASGWSGGSVSPVVPLYHTFAERFPRAAREMAEWVLVHRMNPYEPYGSDVALGITSADAFEKMQRAIQRNRQARLDAEVRCAADAAKRRADEATGNLLNAVRRGDRKAVEALLNKGADANAAGGAESLVSLAEDNGHSALAEYLRARGIQ